MKKLVKRLSSVVAAVAFVLSFSFFAVPKTQQIISKAENGFESTYNLDKLSIPCRYMTVFNYSPSSLPQRLELSSGALNVGNLTLSMTFSAVSSGNIVDGEVSYNYKYSLDFVYAVSGYSNNATYPVVGTPFIYDRPFSYEAIFPVDKSGINIATPLSSWNFSGNYQNAGLSKLYLFQSKPADGAVAPYNMFFLPVYFRMSGAFNPASLYSYSFETFRTSEYPYNYISGGGSGLFYRITLTTVGSLPGIVTIEVPYFTDVPKRTFFYQTALDASSEQNYNYGYDLGYNSGYETGSRDGYNSGYETGENSGFSKGEETGYNKGFSDAMNKISDNDLSNSVRGFVFSLFDAPVSTFLNTFNLSYDGFDLGALVAFIFTGIVVIAVVRLLT